MHPVLFHLGAFPISSFGVMMVIAFLLGNYLLRKDVVAEGYEPIVAEDITFRAAIGGILGAKIYYLIETIPTGQAADNISGLIEIIAGIFTKFWCRSCFPRWFDGWYGCCKLVCLS